MTVTDVRVTLFHPGKNKEERITECALRIFPAHMPVVSFPESEAPNWTAAGCEVVVGRDGVVVEAFSVHDVGSVDLERQDVYSLPNQWDGQVVHLYPR